MNSIFQILTKNVVGCILHLLVFYVVGIVHFSNWVLIIFRLFSGVGLLIKKVVQYSRPAIRRSVGKDLWNVLILGDGDLAKEYICSIIDSP